MKKFSIIIDDELWAFYEEIAKICHKTTEEILQDTLYKAVEIISRTAIEKDKGN